MSKPKTKPHSADRKVALVDQHPQADEAEPSLGEPSHLSIANEILAIRHKLPQAIESYRRRVQTPFRSRMPDEADGFAASELLYAIGMALWGFRSWDVVRNAHAAMRAKAGIQDRHALVLERCSETLVAWRKLPRRRPRGETELERARRVAHVEREEKWLARALILALRELGFKPAAVAPILGKLAERSNGSAVTLASALLDLSEDSLRTAKRKKRQSRS